MYFLLKSWEIAFPHTVRYLGIPFLLIMQDGVLFLSPHFIDDTSITKAECVKDS